MGKFPLLAGNWLISSGVFPAVWQGLRFNCQTMNRNMAWRTGALDANPDQVLEFFTIKPWRRTRWLTYWPRKGHPFTWKSQKPWHYLWLLFFFLLHIRIKKSCWVYFQNPLRLATSAPDCFLNTSGFSGLRPFVPAVFCCLEPLLQKPHSLHPHHIQLVAELSLP